MAATACHTRVQISPDTSKCPRTVHLNKDPNKSHLLHLFNMSLKSFFDLQVSDTPLVFMPFFKVKKLDYSVEFPTF